jgi:hypothetical protein
MSETKRAYKRWAIGERHNYLTFIGPDVRITHKAPATFGVFQCDCGEKIVCERGDVRGGFRESCGCMTVNLRNSVHGNTTREYRPKTYIAWQNMNLHAQKRHIKVCPEWSDFLVFLDDVGEPPADDYVLTIVDAKGIFERGNTEWVRDASPHWTQGKRSDNTSGVKGLSILRRANKPNRWVASVMANGVLHRKTFPFTPEGKEAAIEWLASVRRSVHGKFANDG